MKKIEWKDTRLSFSVDYDYSLFVRNRCVFFWGVGTKWRKIVNYAFKFTRQNNICVVYLYGEPRGKPDTFKNYIKSLSGNIIVINFKTSCADLEAIGRYEEWSGMKKTMGLIDRSGNLVNSYFSERQKIMRAIANGILPETDVMYQNYLNDDKVQSEYTEAKKRLEKLQFEAARCISNCVDLETINPCESGILETIRRIFPFGVEADTTDLNCVKVAKANRYIAQARQGIDNAMGINFSNSEQLSFFSTRGASEMLSYIRRLCDSKLEVDGTFTLCELWFAIEQPPYGAYKCNWYYYIFAFALNPYFANPYSVLFGFIPNPAETVDFAFFIKGNSGRIFLQSKTTVFLKDAVCRLFDLPNQKYIHDALLYARQWCEDNARTPLSWIDNRFLELLDFDCEKWCYRHAADSLLSWISENESELYDKIHNINFDYDDQLIKQGYDTERVRLWRKWSYVKGGAVGWLHGAEEFHRRCITYMNKENICRECGRPIEKYSTYYREALSSIKGDCAVHHNEIVFTAKQTIGLNKKFLGRYQNEYFCIPCLCEVLDSDAERLYEEMNTFREQGCTLFE